MIRTINGRPECDNDDLITCGIPREMREDPGRDWEEELLTTLRACGGMRLPDLRADCRRRAEMGLLAPLTYNLQRFDCAFFRLRNSGAIAFAKGELWVVVPPPAPVTPPAKKPAGQLSLFD